MEYTLESARRLAEELRAIPPKDPAQRRLDKQAMVRELAQELIALQQRGYTIEEVAGSLRERGLEITTPTLKNYLQRAKTGAKARKARRPMGSPGVDRADAAVPTMKRPRARAQSDARPMAPVTTAKAESPALRGSESPIRIGKSAFLIKDQESY